MKKRFEIEWDENRIDEMGIVRWLMLNKSITGKVKFTELPVESEDIDKHLELLKNKGWITQSTLVRLRRLIAESEQCECMEPKKKLCEQPMTKLYGICWRCNKPLKPTEKIEELPEEPTASYFVIGKLNQLIRAFNQRR